jgi:hypothetical protein
MLLGLAILRNTLFTSQKKEVFGLMEAVMEEMHF